MGHLVGNTLLAAALALSTAACERQKAEPNPLPTVAGIGKCAAGNRVDIFGEVAYEVYLAGGEAGQPVDPDAADVAFTRAANFYKAAHKAANATNDYAIGTIVVELSIPDAEKYSNLDNGPVDRAVGNAANGWREALRAAQSSPNVSYESFDTLVYTNMEQKEAAAAALLRLQVHC